MKSIIPIIILVALLLLSVLGISKCTTGIYNDLTTTTNTETITEIVYDTVRVEITDVVIPKPTKIYAKRSADVEKVSARDTLFYPIKYYEYLTDTDTVYLDTNDYVDGLNLYQDTITVDSTILEYTHVVDGTLLASDYSIMYTRPIKTTTTTHTTHRKKYINIYSNTGARLGVYQEVYTGFDVLIGDQWGVGVTAGAGRYDGSTQSSLSLSIKYNILSF